METISITLEELVGSKAQGYLMYSVTENSPCPSIMFKIVIHQTNHMKITTALPT
jgi:hypothetical protein